MKYILPLFFFCGILYAQEVGMGFTAVIAKEDLYTVYKLLDYLSKKTGIALRPVFAKSYDEMDFFLNTSHADIAYICGAPFVEGAKRFGYRVLVVPATEEGPVYYSYVVVRKEKKYSSIFELKDKPYAFSDPKSNSGSVVPTYVLAKKGYKPSDFFRPLIYTYSHAESIMAVYRGFVEGASVDSLVYHQVSKAKPHITKELKVIQKFGPVPTTPFVYREGLSEYVVSKVRDAMLNMDKDGEGRAILQRMGIERFTVVNSNFYKPIANMISYISRYETTVR
ncbi:MAG: phosphate/phosphite/phosphonate ABC transporter substrate-binding protein [Aquificaceae bacterium]